MKQRLLFVFILISLLSCIESQPHLGEDIRLWKDTDIWDFAESISKSDFNEADGIYKQENIDVDTREPLYGLTLLHWAIYNDNVEAVRFLLDRGANPNVHSMKNGTSPIVLACQYFSSSEILRLLLEHGGDPNDHVREDEMLTDGRSVSTPLTDAAFISLEKTKMLVEAGADVDFSVEPGNTPLLHAKWKIVPDVLEYLFFECKANYNKTFIITLDTGDTLTFRDLIESRRILTSEDSIVAKRIIEYIDLHAQN